MSRGKKIINISKLNKNTIWTPWIFACTVYFLVVISLINNNNLCMNLAVVLSIGYVLIFDISSDILLLLGLTIFENAMKFNGILAWFFIILTIIVKYLVVNKGKIKSKRSTALYVSWILAFIVFVTDALSYGIKGQMLTTVALILFWGLITCADFEWTITSERIVLFLGSSFSFAMYYLIREYGGIGNFLNSFMSSTYAYRFGHEFGETIGGSMAIPIYALMILSFSLCAILGETMHKNMVKLIAMMIICVIAFVAGALTISRSFYAGLIIIITIFLLSKTKNTRSRNAKMLLIIITAVISLVVVNNYYDVVIQTVNDLFSRVSVGGGTGGRTDIWKSCFSYLINHPVGLILGYGSNGYPIIGLKSGELFSAGAHNFYIDLLMSWGIVGSLCVLYICRQYRPVKGCIRAFMKNKIIFIPFIVLLFFCTTAMRTNSMKTVVYFFVSMLLIKQESPEQKM